jgi:two-component system alkaline phosphatase synthesis response regulator PhoP
MQGKILVVEDEAAIRNVVRTYLESADFRVECVDSGDLALEALQRFEPDLVVLDLMLPGMDGMEVTARVREESDVYILMLTARSEEMDRVAGLRMGADDYLTKPFSPRELVARVEAMLRRPRTSAATPVADTALAYGSLKVDTVGMEVSVNGTVLDLTTTEFTLLQELARHAGRVLTRDQIIDLVWGNDFFGTDRIVDVYVGQVRRKLEQAGAPDLIQTVRGVGYKFSTKAE